MFTLLMDTIVAQLQPCNLVLIVSIFVTGTAESTTPPWLCSACLPRSGSAMDVVVVPDR